MPIHLARPFLVVRVKSRCAVFAENLHGVAFEPCSQFAPEGFLVGRQSEIHRRYPHLRFWESTDRRGGRAALRLPSRIARASAEVRTPKYEPSGRVDPPQQQMADAKYGSVAAPRRASWLVGWSGS